MPETITSVQNSRIKNLVALQKPRNRRESGLFVIEGVRELKQAISGGYEIVSLFYCDEIAGENPLLADLSDGTEMNNVSKRVYEAVTYRGSTEGILGVSKMKYLDLSCLKLHGNPLLLVIESPEKPGNLGAILRTADAAGITGVIVCDSKTDIYNPNVIRSSLGCLFTVNIAVTDSSAAIDWLKNNGLGIHVTSPEAPRLYYETDYRIPSAIVMGSESSGISGKWRMQADSIIKIPMKGKVDSMNLSVAAAIIVFEAVRQRNNK